MVAFSKTSINRQRHGAAQSQKDWRCKHCTSLLGKHQGKRLELLFGRRHAYVVTLPASCTCRHCGMLNELAPRG